MDDEVTDGTDGIKNRVQLLEKHADQMTLKGSTTTDTVEMIYKQ